jgi:hypothetical protein
MKKTQVEAGARQLIDRHAYVRSVKQYESFENTLWRLQWRGLSSTWKAGIIRARRGSFHQRTIFIRNSTREELICWQTRTRA